MELSPKDSHHFLAAQGWLELGNWNEANEELENITPAIRSHPDILKMRVAIFAMAKHWDSVAVVCEALIRMAPRDPYGYVQGSIALHKRDRTQEAYNLLAHVADRFDDHWEVAYNLACYCSVLKQIEEAEKWFKLAMTLNPGDARKAAIDDPDLKNLLWPGSRSEPT